MAFLDKLTGIAKNIGDKAGEVVETTKLSVKISGEKDKILENQRLIGEYFYNKLQGGDVDAEVKPYFDAIAQSYANIEEFEKDKEAQKSEGSIFDVEESDKPTEPEAAKPADQPVSPSSVGEAPSAQDDAQTSSGDHQE